MGIKSNPKYQSPLRPAEASKKSFKLKEILSPHLYELKSLALISGPAVKSLYSTRVSVVIVNGQPESTKAVVGSNVYAPTPTEDVILFPSESNQ